MPVLIFAGLSPMTQQGELPGTRSEHIHWLQDSADQRGMLRGYAKYDHEIRTGRNVKQLVHRAMQIARSEPAGPVYLVAAREVLEEELPPQPPPGDWWARSRPPRWRPRSRTRSRPRWRTPAPRWSSPPTWAATPPPCPSWSGCASWPASAVIESVPVQVNFPDDHPLHLGYQWNRPEQNPVLAEADVILVLGSDVPWIPGHNRPDAAARIYVIDVDPLKEQMPLWHVPARRYARADLATAVRQLADRLAERGAARPGGRPGPRGAGPRRARRAARAVGRRPNSPAPDGTITPEYLVACVRDGHRPRTRLVLNEAISNYHVVSEHLRASRPGSLLNSGGGSLGWSGGAAVGAKLAAPDRTVVSLVGDGSYLFGVPSSAQWMARRYQAPSLTVIFDNQGWKTPVAVHAGGASRRERRRAAALPPASSPGPTCRAWPPRRAARTRAP